MSANEFVWPSLIANHSFTTSRESALPIWTGVAQTRRALPDATASDLFVRLHGTLFTSVERDVFTPTSDLKLSLFIEGATLCE